MIGRAASLLNNTISSYNYKILNYFIFKLYYIIYNNHYSIIYYTILFHNYPHKFKFLYRAPRLIQ